MSALFGFTGPWDPDLAKAMSSSLSHRIHAPATWLPSQTIHLGFAPGGNAPSLFSHESPDGHAAVLVGNLFAPSHDSNPARECLNLLLQKGPSGLDDLRGAFLLALRYQGKLILIRDGAGHRTFYYSTLLPNRFLFSIEPKGISSAPGFPKTLRPGALAQFLSFSFIPGSETMLKGLSEGLPGHQLTYEPDRHQTTQRAFFLPQLSEPTDIPDPVNAFRETFRDCVRSRLPQRPVAALLSGGLDSSLVVAELSALPEYPFPLKTFSIHFGTNYPNELEFAKKVAIHHQTDHEEVLIQPKDFLPHLQDLIWRLDEPVGDPVTMPNYLLAKYIGTQFTHVFNGEGGDPCFGGPKNLPMLLSQWYPPAHPSSRYLEQAYLTSFKRAYEELDWILTPEFRELISIEHDLEDLLTPFFEAPAPTSFLNKLQWMNMRLKGAHLILPKVERMMAAGGLTPCSPLFDERMMEWSFKLPPTEKLHHGIEKGILKKAFATELPPEIIQRPKSGMRVPVHFWFQKELKSWCRDLLHPLTLKQAGIFNPDRVQKLLNYETAEGPGRYGIRLWMLMTFELWRRQGTTGT